MPKKKTVRDTPKRVRTKIDEPFHSVRKKRTKYVKKSRRISFDDRRPSPELDFDQPSTSSAAEPIEYASFVTPENLKRYSGAPPGSCAILRYKRSPQGHWTFHKKLSQYVLNAYKDSPDYKDLKNKRFNTSFLHETRRGPRDDIQIFTPEEENDPNAWWNNMPTYGQKYMNMTDQAPGEKYKDFFYTGIFAKMPSVLEDDDYKRFLKKEAKMKKEEVREIVKVRRRRSNIGRAVLSRKRRGPLPDESVNFDWDSLGPDFFLPSESEDDDEENQKKKKRKPTKKRAVSKHSLGKDAKDIDASLNQSQDSIKKKTRGKSEVARKRSKGKASVDNLPEQLGKGDKKNLKRKLVRKVPAKTAKGRKCIDIDSDDEAVSSDYSLSSIDFNPSDPAMISYYTDCVKRNRELDEMEKEALKNQKASKNPKECKRAAEGKPLLDDLFLCRKKSCKSASDVGVKNQKAKDKKALTQKRGKSEESSAQKEKRGSMKNKSGGSKIALKRSKASSDKKIDPGPLTSTVTSQSLMKSKNKLSTDFQNNSSGAEDQNIGDPIPCSILLNLLKSSPPKVSSPSGEEKSKKESSAFAGSDRRKKLPRVGEKANGAKNSKDVAIREVKLLPDEIAIENRVLRVFLNKG